MITVEKYLSREGYKSPEDWAIDSGFAYNDNTDVWQNDDGAVLLDPYNYIELLINEGLIS